MNIENMRKLRKHLRWRKNPVKFNMGNWFTHNGVVKTSRDTVLNIVEEHPCGTVACLAGHAAILAWQEGDTTGEERGHNSIFIAAQKSLGLTEDQADQLFYGYWSSILGGLKKIPKTHAIAELTRLIDEYQ